MDEISSSEFRKTYASLTEETVVTVNGHQIGRWVPSGKIVPIAAEDARLAQARPETVYGGQCLYHGYVTERCCALFEVSQAPAVLGPGDTHLPARAEARQEGEGEAMSKRHTIYVLVDAEGRYVDAFLSYSEAVREDYRAPGGRIIRVFDREDY